MHHTEMLPHYKGSNLQKGKIKELLAHVWQAGDAIVRTDKVIIERAQCSVLNQPNTEWFLNGQNILHMVAHAPAL